MQSDISYAAWINELTRSRLNTRTSFVIEYVSFSNPTTCGSCRNLSTEFSHIADQSASSLSMGEHSALLIASIQFVNCGRPAVRMIRPENRLLTRFSRMLMVSTRVVTPTTAMPLLPGTALQLCTVSSRQYRRDCRACKAKRSNASRMTRVGRGSVGSIEINASRCDGGGSVTTVSLFVWMNGFSSSCAASSLSVGSNA